MRASDADRDAVIELLRSHQAAGRLSLVEFESRVETALRAPTLGELDRLSSDLPVAVPAPAPVPVPPPARRRRRPVRVSVGFLSWFRRRGDWSPTSRTVAVAFLGGGTLDFRDAALEPGSEVTVIAVSFLGHLGIRTPPDVELSGDGVSFLGYLDVQTRSGQTPASARVRVHAYSFLGSVRARTRAARKAERSRD